MLFSSAHDRIANCITALCSARCNIDDKYNKRLRRTDDNSGIAWRVYGRSKRARERYSREFRHGVRTECRFVVVTTPRG